MPRRSRLILAAVPLLLVLAAALVGSLDQGDLAEGLLIALPGVLLLLPLVFGRYVGEVRLRALMPGRRAARAAAPGLLVRLPQPLLPRGGSLVASSLAERGPPRPLLHG